MINFAENIVNMGRYINTGNAGFFEKSDCKYSECRKGVLYMKVYHFLIICILQTLFLNNAIGQELIVRNLIQDPSDISASTNRQMDSNNEPCALLKVQVTDQVIGIEDTEIIGDFQRFGATTWIYVPHGTKQFTLLFEEHNPVTIQMRDYGIDQMNRLSTYVLTLFDKSGYSDPDNPTDAIAQYELGLDYRMGRRGRDIDYEKAFKWLSKSAEQGYDQAQTMIGSIYMETYEKFTRDPSDFENCISWWEKAATQGNVAARFNLAEAFINHATDETAKDYNPKALKWAIASAELGHTRAMELVGDLLTQHDWFEIDGIERDTATGISWYEKASNKGSGYASFKLGWIYQKGIGVQKNTKLAKMWYRKACNQGEQQGCNRLSDPDLN